MNKLTVNHSTDTGFMELDEITKLTVTANSLDVAVAASSSAAAAAVTEEPITGPSYNVVPHPGADAPDWSGLRGVPKLHAAEQVEDSEHDLENLAELVPDIKARRSSAGGTPHPIATQPSSPRVLDDSGNGQEEAVEVVETDMEHHHTKTIAAADAKKKTGGKPPKPSLRKASMCSTRNDNLVHRVDSMLVQDSMDVGDGRDTQHRQRKLNLNHHPSNNNNNNNVNNYNGAGADPSSNNVGDSTSYDEDYNGSDQAYNDNNQDDVTKMPKEFVNMESSAQSISTATQTHEVVRLSFFVDFNFLHCSIVLEISLWILPFHVILFYIAHAHVLAHLQARHGLHQRLGFYCSLFCGPTPVWHYRRQARTLALVQVALANPAHSPRRALPFVETSRRRTHFLQTTTETRSQYLSRSTTRLVTRPAEPHVHGHAHSSTKVRSRQRAQEFCSYFQTADGRCDGRHGRSVQSTHGGIFGTVLSFAGGESGNGGWSQGQECGARPAHARRRRSVDHGEQHAHQQFHSTNVTDGWIDLLD